MKFTVNKSRWARQTQGIKKGESSLLNEKNNKCCLGFVCQQLGIPTKVLKGQGSPDIITLYSGLSEKKKENYGEKMSILLDKRGNDNDFTCKAVTINDDKTTTDNIKINKLKTLFKKNGHSIKFV